jgi:hypothetical protein
MGNFQPALTRRHSAASDYRIDGSFRAQECTGSPGDGNAVGNRTDGRARRRRAANQTRRNDHSDLPSIRVQDFKSESHPVGPRYVADRLSGGWHGGEPQLLTFGYENALRRAAIDGGHVRKHDQSSEVQ